MISWTGVQAPKSTNHELGQVSAVPEVRERGGEHEAEQAEREADEEEEDAVARRAQPKSFARVGGGLADLHEHRIDQRL